MFSFFTHNPKGAIKYFGLSEWWLSEFSEEERSKIISSYGPGGVIDGEFSNISVSATSFLSNLADWVKGIENRAVAYKLLSKAEELISTATVSEKHFFYQIKIQIYYRYREEDSSALNAAVSACEQQIAMHKEASQAFRNEYGDQILPMHVGFTQLCIIRERQGNYDEAIRLCNEAMMEGWGGDWEKRIERYTKKKLKVS